MVRINLLEPWKLSDQHLVAEYNEILMLFGHVRKHPEARKAPKEYVLGTGHIQFFKDKLLYLRKRHESLKQEMEKRGFKPTKEVKLDDFDIRMRNNWFPQEKDFELIRERIEAKLILKPDYYRYFGKKRDADFFKNIVEQERKGKKQQ